MKPVIVAVHTPSEVALTNTLRRFERAGRGASIEAMASIQGELANGLAAIEERFGDAVDFRLFDRRQWDEHRGRASGLAAPLHSRTSEGNYESIKTRLSTALDQHEATGAFSADAIRQARGLSPLSRNRELSFADGREPADPRPGEAEGPQPIVAANGAQEETGKAESALARGIEADQVRLQSQGAAGERYHATLRTYLEANAQRLGRIEDRLETLIENQQAALGELETQRPGFFASAGTRTGWSADVEASRDRLQTLRGRLARVEELKEQSSELAEEKMREREPELAGAWDAARREARAAQTEQRREQQKTRQNERSQEQGRELEL